MDGMEASNNALVNFVTGGDALVYDIKRSSIAESECA